MSYGLTVLAVTISLLISIYTVYITSHGFIFNQTLYQWLSSGSYTFEIGFLIDNLTALMMVVVTFVSLFWGEFHTPTKQAVDLTKTPYNKITQQ